VKGTHGNSIAMRASEATQSLSSGVAMTGQLVRWAIFIFLVDYPGSGHASGGGLTVRDSIELTTFSDPATRDPLAKVKVAPNGKNCAVVTTRGVIASNEIESTLWIFSTREAADHVQFDRGSPGLAPMRIAVLKGTPQAEQRDSYGSLITAVKWSSDSKSVFFLGENRYGRRQLYRSDIEQAAAQPLTNSDQDIERFSENAGAIVYEAGVIEPAGPAIGMPINDSASLVGGLRMPSILFPHAASPFRGLEIRAIKRGREAPILDSTSSQSLKASRLIDSEPAISPDGGRVIVGLPVPAIPPLWEAYRTTLPALLGFKAQIADAAALSGKRLLWPAQYALLDLEKNSVRRLVNAPGGAIGGFADDSGATWSPSGKLALLGNTYLPLLGVAPAERLRRLQPCAAAVVRIASGELSCVTFTRSADREGRVWAVYAAEFGKSDDEVVLRLRWYADQRTERYRYRAGRWQNTATLRRAGDEPTVDPAMSAGSSSLRIEVKQNLNMPPALWAIDVSTGEAHKLWDPNPQLTEVRFGEASVYHWEDSSGYSWKAALIKPIGYRFGERYPLIIQTHGFHNEHEFITDGAYTTAFAARPLAAAGFMVLETRDRHDHEGTSAEAPNMVRGFESAIDTLSADGLIDPERVGIIGFSRTSYYAESALIHNQQRYAAAVIAEGVDESYMQYLLFGEGRDFHEEDSIYNSKPFGAGLKNWVDAAPGFQLDRVQAPVMIQAITATSILAEWEIYASLRLQKKAVEMMYIPDGQHILQKPIDRLASQQSSVDWFRFWLQGYEDPAAEKAGQYRRWEQLCDMQVSQNPNQPSFCVRTKTH